MRRTFTITGALLGVLAAAVLMVTSAFTSSHNEAPGSAKDPSADWTDLYAFVAPDATDKVTIVANVNPFQLPNGGPNFNNTLDPKARYYINIDNTGDGVADVRYRYEFRDVFRGTAKAGYPSSLPTVDSVNSPNLAYLEKYKLLEERYKNGKRTGLKDLLTQGVVAPANAGPKTMPNYAAVSASAQRNVSGGIKSFVGSADDPFFIDLGGAFDSINLCRATGNEGGCRDDISGFNVNSLVLQVPKSRITSKVGGPNIGVWVSTERQRLQINAVGRNRTKNSEVSAKRKAKGTDWVQVNRLGNPLVNELVVPVAFKDTFNSTQPKDDKQYAGPVLAPFPAKGLNLLFDLGIKETDRTDLVTALLTGIPGVTAIGKKPAIADTLKLNTSVAPTASPNRFGVIGGDNAGFPNGRRLADDVVDITLRVVGGFLVPADQGGKKLPLGDGVDQNDVPFRSTFPYVALPQPGSGDGDNDGVRLAYRVEPVHAPTPGDNPG